MAETDQVKRTSANDATSPEVDHKFLIPTLQLTPYTPHSELNPKSFFTAVPKIVQAGDFYAEVDRYLIGAGFATKFSDTIKHNTQRRKDYGYIRSTNFPIQFKVLPDFELTDSMTNDYSESFVASAINSRSQDRLREASQMFGGKTDLAKTVTDKVAEVAKDLFGDYGNDVGNLLTGAGRLLAGGRKDASHIWSGTSFQQSYPFSTVLRCDNPKNIEQYTMDIVKPLAILLNLATPRTQKSETGDNNPIYNWPYIIQASMLGVFRIKLGAITNIDITKTTEYGLADNQRPKAVKVTFNIVNLYHVLLGGDYGSNNNTADSTISSYLEPFKQSATTQYSTAGFEVLDPVTGKVVSEDTQRTSGGINSLNSKPFVVNDVGAVKFADAESKTAITQTDTVDPKPPTSPVGDTTIANETADNQNKSIINDNLSSAGKLVVETSTAVKIAVVETIDAIAVAVQNNDLALAATETAHKADLEYVQPFLFATEGLIDDAGNWIDSKFGSEERQLKIDASKSLNNKSQKLSDWGNSVVNKEPALLQADKQSAYDAASLQYDVHEENINTLDGYAGKQLNADLQKERSALLDIKSINEYDSISSINKESELGAKTLNSASTLTPFDNSKVSFQVLSNSERQADTVRDYDTNKDVTDNFQTAAAKRNQLAIAAQYQFDQAYATLSNTDKRDVLDEAMSIDNAAITDNNIKLAALPPIPVPLSREDDLKNYYDNDNFRRVTRITDNNTAKLLIPDTGTPTVQPTTAEYKRNLNSVNYNLNLTEQIHTDAETAGDNIDSNDEDLETNQTAINAIVYPSPPSVIVGDINNVPKTYAEIQIIETPQ